jgi:Pyruvate/2-oxoacid:ferredoxin oxidoreductase delta subunit
VEELEVTVPSNGRKGVVLNPRERRFRRFDVLQPILEADIIINLPKLKTHGLTYITGATKNLFGLIPGLEKSRWHMKAPGAQAFSELLLDLNEALMVGFSAPKPILHLVDAVVGQEGDGPGPSGTPREIGAVLAGTNPVATDCVAADLLGFDYRSVPSVVGGFERNLGVSSPNEIECVGEVVDGMRLHGFKPARHKISTATYDRWPFNRKRFRNLVTSRPVPQREKCTLCYQCMAICPAGAIEKAEGGESLPRYLYEKCIRCYCCMEICPEAAVKLKSGALEWLMPG